MSEPKKQVRLERWTSDENEEEVHMFLGNTYVIGYNPEMISIFEISKILEKQGLALPG